MLCPNCKNEKWDADTCPQCGLDEKAALLSLAGSFQKAGKWRQAAEIYDKYLKLDPEGIDVKRRRAACLCQEASAILDPSLFESAGVLLDRVLDEDWGWEEGHRLRMDLFYHFGKLDMLLAQYEKMGLKDGERKAFCDQMTRIIRLTEQFMKNPPIVHTSLAGEGHWLKSYWPLVFGLPIVIVTAIAVSALPHSNGGNGSLFLFLSYVILGIIVLALFFATMQMRKGKKNPNGDMKIGPPDQP